MSTVFHHHDAYQFATLIEAMRKLGKNSPNVVQIVDRL